MGMMSCITLTNGQIFALLLGGGIQKWKDKGFQLSCGWSAEEAEQSLKCKDSRSSSSRKFTMSIKKNNEDSIADGDVEILNTDVVTG